MPDLDNQPEAIENLQKEVEQFKGFLKQQNHEIAFTNLKSLASLAAQSEADAQTADKANEGQGISGKGKLTVS